MIMAATTEDTTIKPTATEEVSETAPGLPIYLDKLTSSVINTSNPPEDWADLVFLVPHEGIRHQMNGMMASANALDASNTKNPWKVLYFCKWFSEHFFDAVNTHHENEENIYFPFVAERAGDEVNKEMNVTHETLMTMMTEIKAITDAVIMKGGEDCSGEIASLKEKIPPFVEDMKAHLAAEERDYPPLVRKHFTKEENDKCLEDIIKKEGLVGARSFLPWIVLAMDEWAQPVLQAEFQKEMPGPVRHLLNTYFLPDMEDFVIPMRDAPLLKNKPALKKVGCCGIPFCFPCII